ncbi:MAG: GNAT family N-acetyltransferase [Verrucomicrobiales bacterium]|nr:GNAT family N-acetyltransferase [Verrucomicrobiales bacterium]
MSDPREVVSPPRRRRRKPVSVEVRAMVLADLSAVFELGQQLFTAEKWPTLYRGWDEHELLALFHSEGETCLVAEAEGRVVGFALGRVMEKPRNAWRYGWLLWLGVRPEFHRGRVATRLLKRLTELFVAREARIMLVDTDEQNRHAVAFFKRQGFGQAVRHVYLSRNLDDHPRNIERRFEGADAEDD